MSFFFFLSCFDFCLVFCGWSVKVGGENPSCFTLAILAIYFPLDAMLCSRFKLPPPDQISPI